jgi:hypothetical protein
VQQGVLAVWATLVISALGGVIALRVGQSTREEFAGSLFLYALLCIIPHKISNGSNAARYVFVVLNALAVLLMLSGMPGVNQVDRISMFIQLPLVCFAVFKLFDSEANGWFRPSDHLRRGSDL